MSDISEVISALKRGDLILVDTLNEMNTSLNTAKKEFDNLKKPILELQEFEQRQNSEISKYESGNLNLSQEITSLKEEKFTKERLLSDRQNNYVLATENRTKLETQKRDILTELSTTEKKLEIVNSDLITETDTHKRLLAEINHIIETTEHKILEIEKKIETERDVIRKTKGERMALQYLIKYNHIEFNEIKVINSLDGRKNTDIETIAKVTGLSNALIEKTLEGLMKRNVLKYDRSSGGINIIGSLRL